MRFRHQPGPGYAKVDHKADEYTDGYTSAGNCNSKGTCKCMSCLYGTHNFKNHGQHCNNHDGDCHDGC